MDKTSFKIFVFAMILVLVILSSALIFSTFREEKTVEKRDVVEVSNVNMFFTIESIVNKYTSHLSVGDEEIVCNLLNKKYKNRLNITKENVFSYVDKLDNTYNFTATKMYINKTNKDLYYVKGYLIEEAYYADLRNRKNFIVTVEINENNRTFSIIPDGEGSVFE